MQAQTQTLAESTPLPAMAFITIAITAVVALPLMATIGASTADGWPCSA